MSRGEGKNNNHHCIEQSTLTNSIRARLSQYSARTRPSSGTQQQLPSKPLRVLQSRQTTIDGILYHDKRIGTQGERAGWRHRAKGEMQSTKRVLCEAGLCVVAQTAAGRREEKSAAGKMSSLVDDDGNRVGGSWRRKGNELRSVCASLVDDGKGTRQQRTQHSTLHC